MVDLYRMIGITKQAHYKRIASQDRQVLIANDLVAQAHQIRLEHRRMGCRKLYHEIKPVGIGRDKAECILLSNGFRVKRKRNYYRTTYAGKYWHSNHLTGRQITDINQVWVSDITYIPVSPWRRFYLTLVQDVYSRRVVGWSLSQTMQADKTVLPAYKMAIVKINIKQRQGLVFHSDKGSQYIYKELLQLHDQYGVTPSMGGKAWENAHAESLNGIIKNEYLDLEGSDIKYQEALQILKSTIEKYNCRRPHGSLKMMKPVEYEKHIKQLTVSQKPTIKINY